LHGQSDRAGHVEARHLETTVTLSRQETRSFDAAPFRRTGTTPFSASSNAYSCAAVEEGKKEPSASVRPRAQQRRRGTDASKGAAAPETDGAANPKAPEATAAAATATAAATAEGKKAEGARARKPSRRSIDHQQQPRASETTQKERGTKDRRNEREMNGRSTSTHGCAHRDVCDEEEWLAGASLQRGGVAARAGEEAKATVTAAPTWLVSRSSSMSNIE
jgi:hypothetical protein